MAKRERNGAIRKQEKAKRAAKPGKRLDRRQLVRAGARALGALGATLALPRVAQADLTSGSGTGNSVTVTKGRTENKSVQVALTD